MASSTEIYLLAAKLQQGDPSALKKLKKLITQRDENADMAEDALRSLNYEEDADEALGNPAGNPDFASNKAGNPGNKDKPDNGGFTEDESEVDALAEDYLLAENYADAEKARDKLMKIANENDSSGVPTERSRRAEGRLVDVEYDRTEPVIDSLKGLSAAEMRNRLEKATGLEEEEVNRALGDLSWDDDNAETALLTAKSGVNPQWQKNALRDKGAQATNPDGTASGENLYDSDDQKNREITAKVAKRNAGEQAARTRAENEGNKTDTSAKGLPPGIKKTKAGVYFAEDPKDMKSVSDPVFAKMNEEGLLDTPTRPKDATATPTHKMVSGNFGGKDGPVWNLVPVESAEKYERNQEIASRLTRSGGKNVQKAVKPGRKSRGIQGQKGVRPSPKKGLPTHGPKRKGARNSKKGGNWFRQPRDPRTGRWIDSP